MRTIRTPTELALLTVAIAALLATSFACGRSGESDRSRIPGETARGDQTVPIGVTPSSPPEDGGVPQRPVPTVSGELYLRDRIAFPAGTVVKLRVVRLGATGPTASVVAAVDLPAPRRLPIPFEVACDPASIEEGAAYALEAEIVRGGAVVFTTTSPVPVLAGGLPTKGLKLLLRRVS